LWGGTLIGRTLVRLCKRLRGRGIKPCSRLPTLVLSLSLESLYIMSLTTHSPTQTKTLDTKP
jgi:hypothetical protein